ncbi:DMT family transporter [Kiloniella laminariae]|uniref:DMT family transporter n=1 Tax=Kiloniella laminariae TaxID=454162 RepID=UPI00039F3C18|nr:EamA family transporter [Kiloniella laminariae]
MSPQKPGLRQYLLLLLLGAIWGSSFLFIKISLESITPVTLTAFRLLLAFLVMITFVFALGKKFPTGFHIWRKYAVVAISGNILPFILISWGELHIESGLAAILMAIIPLSTLVVAHFWTDDEKLSLPKLAGTSIGFAGVVLLVGPEALRGLGDSVLGQLAVAVASFSYGITSVYARKSGLTKQDPMVNGASILLLASLMAIPLAFAIETPLQLEPSGRSLLALLALAVLSTAIAYTILYYLLSTAGATYTALNNYIVPVAGMLWGYLFLSERYDAEAFTALLVIFIGIVVSQFGRRQKKQEARPCPEAV